MQRFALAALYTVLSAGSMTQAAITMYPNKASLLAAVHGDLLNISGFATGSLTAHPAMGYSGNGRSMTIDSNVSGSTRLMSWGTGIGAPNPGNTTFVSTGAVRYATAFGCYLRVANNQNQSIGGTVQISVDGGSFNSFTVNVPSSGMYLAFTSSTLISQVGINATSGTLVEMIDDVLIAQGAGGPATDHAADAGLAVLGVNSFDTRGTIDDQSSFLDSFGTNYGNARDVWWTFTPPTTGALSADTFGTSFDTLLSVYDGANAPPGAGALPLSMNDDSGGSRQSALAVHVDAGRRYFIRVGGFNGATGPGQLNVSFVPDINCQADFNNDGAIDFFDYLDFVDAFSIGC